LPQQIEVVEDGEMLRRVAKRAERSQDVRLGFPILRLHLRAQVLVDRRGNLASKSTRTLSFFSRYFVRLNLPVKR
jgi:hypothetical protein